MSVKRASNLVYRLRTILGMLAVAFAVSGGIYVLEDRGLFVQEVVTSVGIVTEPTGVGHALRDGADALFKTAAAVLVFGLVLAMLLPGVRLDDVIWGRGNVADEGEDLPRAAFILGALILLASLISTFGNSF